MRKVIGIFLSAIKLLFFRWRAWLVVFVANLIFAMLIAFPFGRLLNKLGEHSEAPLKGLLGFDLNFIADVINNYGTGLHLVVGQMMAYASLYLVLNIFLSGGLIEAYVHLFGRFSLSEFLANCAKHFWRLFRLALYFVGAQIVVVAVLGYIFVQLGLSPFDLESDTVLITRTRVMFVILVLLIGWIDMVNEYAKVRVVTQKEKTLILPLLIRVKFFCLKHFFPILALFLLCVLSFLLVLGLYSVINDVITMTSTGTIIMAFLIGQVYLIFRIGTRLLFTSAATDYLRSHNWGE